MIHIVCCRATAVYGQVGVSSLFVPCCIHITQYITSSWSIFDRTILLLLYYILLFSRPLDASTLGPRNFAQPSAGPFSSALINGRTVDRIGETIIYRYMGIRLLHRTHHVHRPCKCIPADRIPRPWSCTLDDNFSKVNPYVYSYKGVLYNVIIHVLLYCFAPRRVFVHGRRKPMINDRSLNKLSVSDVDGTPKRIIIIIKKNESRRERNANDNPLPETLDMYAGMSSGPVVSSAASRAVGVSVRICCV